MTNVNLSRDGDFEFSSDLIKEFVKSIINSIDAPTEVQLEELSSHLVFDTPYERVLNYYETIAAEFIGDMVKAVNKELSVQLCEVHENTAILGEN